MTSTTPSSFLSGPNQVGEAALTFSVIYADPPWQYDFAETDNRKIENHYPTMNLAEICCMEIPAARNSVLYMWATAPKLLEGVAVMRSWGFSYKTHAMWDKGIAGMGYWFRGQHELLMVGTRGTISPPQPELRISSVIKCGRGKHSSKPEYVRDMIEKWYPDAERLELFSRLKRPGWEVFGNQVEYDLLSGAVAPSSPPLRNELPQDVAPPQVNNRGGSQDVARESVRSTDWLGEAASSEGLNGQTNTPCLPDMEESKAASPNDLRSAAGTRACAANTKRKRMDIKEELGAVPVSCIAWLGL